MSEIQDNEYVLYKTIAEFIQTNIQSSLSIVNAKCGLKLAEYEKSKSEFMACKTYEGVGNSSKILNNKRQELISLFAIQDRIESIQKRNVHRLEYINSYLQKVGIYNTSLDKKSVMKAINDEKNEVNEQSLNLNFGGDNITYKLVNGEILAFKNNKLDLSLEFNLNALSDADASFYHELVTNFPWAVGTIPDDYYIISSIKNNILRECILYVASKMKTQSIKQSNAELGGLLAGAGNIRNIQEYANELKNYLNVCAKQSMKINMPKLEDEINAGLRCNESSEFLPASKRVAPLSAGIAGDIPKTEAEVSEDVRKEQEKETQKSITNAELMELLMADEDEIESQSETQENAKRAEEERKLNELEEENKKIKQLEEELAMSLRKNDSGEE